MEKIIKHIEHNSIVNFKDEVTIMKDQIVSKTLVQNPHVSLTLFAFDENTEISTHESKGDALITILEGQATITIDEEKFVLSQGESIVMGAGLPHSVYASKAFKMLLNVVF